MNSEKTERKQQELKVKKKNMKYNEKKNTKRGKGEIGRKKKLGDRPTVTCKVSKYAEST